VAITSHAARASSTVGLHWAIVAVCPLYALGGLIMLAAVRHYPRDISYVVTYAGSRNGRNKAAASSGSLSQSAAPTDSGTSP
jgi:hypothetical protein